MTGDSGRADASCLSDGCGGTPAGLEAPGGSLPDDDLGGYCSTCRFWLFKVDRSPAGTVVEELDDGSRHRYYFNPAEPVVHTGNPSLHLGFGGTPWRVRFFNGRIVETNDLYGEGEIPARFRHMFPPNASLERLGSYGGDRADGGPPLHLARGGRTFGPAPADAATWRNMQGLAAMAERSPHLRPGQVAAERQAASQTWVAALRAAHPDAAETAASWEAVIGSPEHYANFEKYFTLQNGVGFSFPDDPRASYECFYAYGLEPEPEAALARSPGKAPLAHTGFREKVPAMQGTDDLDVTADLRQSFRDALADATEGTGLEAHFDLSHTLSWVQPRDGDGNVGYWIGCGLAQDPALPPGAWPTHLSVTYLALVDSPSSPAPLRSERPVDLVMAGTGARDARILATTAVSAVLDHQRALALDPRAGAPAAAITPKPIARDPGIGPRDTTQQWHLPGGRPDRNDGLEAGPQGTPGPLASLEFPAGPAISPRRGVGDAPTPKVRRQAPGLHQGRRLPGGGSPGSLR